MWHWCCQVSLGASLAGLCPLLPGKGLLCPGLSSARAAWLIHQLSLIVPKGRPVCPPGSCSDAGWSSEAWTGRAPPFPRSPFALLPPALCSTSLPHPELVPGLCFGPFSLPC